MTARGRILIHPDNVDAPNCVHYIENPANVWISKSGPAQRGLILLLNADYVLPADAVPLTEWLRGKQVLISTRVVKTVIIQPL